MWLFPGLLGTTSWRANPVGWWSNFHLRQPFQQPPFRGRGSFHFSHHSSSSQRPRDLRMPDLYQTHQESFHQPFHHQWVSLSSNFQKEEEKSSLCFCSNQAEIFLCLSSLFVLHASMRMNYFSRRHGLLSLTLAHLKSHVLKLILGFFLGGQVTFCFWNIWYFQTLYYLL